MKSQPPDDYDPWSHLKEYQDSDEFAEVYRRRVIGLLQKHQRQVMISRFRRMIRREIKRRQNGE